MFRASTDTETQTSIGTLIHGHRVNVFTVISPCKQNTTSSICHKGPQQQRTVTMTGPHHQQGRWWEWPFPLVRRTCVCAGAVSSACNAWCCGNPLSGLHCWNGGALVRLSSPPSQRDELSEPCYMPGNSCLGHPDSRIYGLCCQDGRVALWDLWTEGVRQVSDHMWGFTKEFKGDNSVTEKSSKLGRVHAVGWIN